MFFNLTAIATIEKETDNKYLVWFGPDEKDWRNNAFVAGSYPSFDAAVAACLSVHGFIIGRIQSE